jgi:hypothetical protein
MLSWRSWGSSSTAPRYYGRGARLQLPLGISIFASIGSLVVGAIARGVIGGLWAERRRRWAIEGLRDHYIICGFGRVGQRVAEEFRHMGTQFVVVAEEELCALDQLFAPRETLAR